MSELLSICEELRQAPAISLVIHERPDGDAIGSAAAIFHYFPKKDIEIVSVSPLPTVFTDITGPLAATQRPTKQLIVLLDCAQIERTGLRQEILAARKNGARVLAFDHHQRSSLNKYVDNLVHDSSASSTAEVLFGCVDLLRDSISPHVAQCLLMGIFTDTACFRHPTTTSQTLRVASRLIRCGGNLERLQRAFGEHRTIGKTKLWGKALSTVQLDPTGLAVAIITQTDLRQNSADERDVAGLANTLALLDQARAAAVLVEAPKGYRVALRTRHSDVDLRRLAQYFEGKGMQKAVGFFATNPIFSGKIKAT